MLLELEGGVVSAALHHGYITSASVEEEGGRLQSSRLSLTLMNGFITSDRAEPGRTNRERPRGGCLGRSLLSCFKHQLLLSSHGSTTTSLSLCCSDWDSVSLALTRDSSGSQGSFTSDPRLGLVCLTDSTL